MSKLQTAIQKLSEAKSDDQSGKSRRKELARLEVDSNDSRALRALSYSRQIVVNTDALKDEGIIVSEEQSVELRDEIRRLKWPLLENAFGEQSVTIPNGNIVMVTSATAGEGKTFTTINLAMSIATERDINVLLVDTDIAKPHVSRLFGLSESPGVIDYVAGEVSNLSELIVRTDIKGLNLFPAGRPDENASELIASNAMSNFVSELDARLPGTILLFDTSPLMQTNESQVLARLAGQVVFIVGANKAPQPAILEAISLLSEASIVNVVLNGVQSLFRQKHRYGGYDGYQSRR
jgi:exopolysaccharide/PEP-CTERM locus tyrosine autokinase